MSELIKVDQKALDSREVAEMVGKRHDHLVRDIDGYITVLNQNPNLGADSFFTESTYQSGTGKSYRYYLVTKMGCELIAHKLTGQRGVEFTAAYVKKFNLMEQQQVLDNVVWFIPKTMSQALQLAANLQTQIEEQAPKVLFADSVATSKNSILIGAMAKILNQNGIDIGQNRFFKWLRDNEYLGKRGNNYNLPTQKSMELGLFEIKETAITHSDGYVETKRTPKVTGKGQIYFVDKFLLTNQISV